jgi:hypothetical protein
MGSISTGSAVRRGVAVRVGVGEITWVAVMVCVEVGIMVGVGVDRSSLITCISRYSPWACATTVLPERVETRRSTPINSENPIMDVR